ncbi:MAG TPA: sugar ABC transporter permease, partial [Spirochaetota bacterium]
MRDGIIIKSIRANMRTYTMILALLFFWVLFGSMTVQYDAAGGGIQWGYMSAQNLSNLFRQMTITSFLSCGMVLVIVTGNIDLSVGKLAGFVSVVAASLQAYVWNTIFPDSGLLSAALTVVVAVGVGTLIGVAQGAVIAFLRVPAFIVTLGGMWIFNGGILIVTQGRTIPANQPAFSVIGQG